jgi:hypothetical protein
MADDGRQTSRRRQQPFQIDPGVAAHRRQHVDRVLAADVAAGAGRVGAATQPTQRAVQAGDAALHRGQHIGQPHAARVVEVQGDLPVAEARERGLDHAAHLCRADRNSYPRDAGRTQSDHFLSGTDTRFRPRALR